MNTLVQVAIEALKAHPESRTEGLWYEAALNTGQVDGETYEIDEIIESLEEDAATPNLAIIPEWRLEQQRLMRDLLFAVRGWYQVENPDYIDTEIEVAVDDFIASFDGSERQNAIASEWHVVPEAIAYSDLSRQDLNWMRRNLVDGAKIAKYGHWKRCFKAGRGAEWYQNRLSLRIQFALESNESQNWNAEMADRAAPNDPELHRWMLS